MTPPVAGAEAASEDATTWTMRETVYVQVGRVVHDQLRVGPNGATLYGPEYCSELKVLGPTRSVSTPRSGRSCRRSPPR